jgi:hypothetical protein
MPRGMNEGCHVPLCGRFFVCARHRAVDIIMDMRCNNDTVGFVALLSPACSVTFRMSSSETIKSDLKGITWPDGCLIPIKGHLFFCTLRHGHCFRIFQTEWKLLSCSGEGGSLPSLSASKRQSASMKVKRIELHVLY